MEVERNKINSKILQSEMKYNRYGKGKRALILFPTNIGDEEEYEKEGFISELSSRIDNDELSVYTLETRDRESWLSYEMPEKKGEIYDKFIHYFMEEFMPRILQDGINENDIIIMGIRIGGYNAINIALKYPDKFFNVISISGVYSCRYFTPRYEKEINIYNNSPIEYLKDIEDEKILQQYMNNKFIICVSQQRREQNSIESTSTLMSIFNQLGIPARFDFWGIDSNNEWDWWKKQGRYYINSILK